MGKRENTTLPPVLCLEGEPRPSVSPGKLLSSGPRAGAAVGTFYERVEGMRAQWPRGRGLVPGAQEKLGSRQLWEAEPGRGKGGGSTGHDGGNLNICLVPGLTHLHSPFHSLVL